MLAQSPVSKAAIGIDTTGGGTSTTPSVTVAVNSDRTLFVSTGAGNFSTPTACTYNSVTMSITESQDTSGDDVSIQYLDGPDTGAHTLACTGLSAEQSVAWVSAYNVASGGEESKNSCTNSGGGGGDTTTCTPATISSGSILFGAFKCDRNVGTLTSSFVTVVTSSATAGTGYGVGATTWSISGLGSNCQSKTVSGSYQEVGGAAGPTGWINVYEE